MVAQDWPQSLVSEADYIGWRGLGPLLGVRYFADVCDGYVILVEKHPFGGIKIQWISNLAVIYRGLRKPSLFYLVCGVLATSLADPGTFVDNIILLVNNDVDGFIQASRWLLVSVIIGIMLNWLFDRPRIDLVVEGGIRIGSYAGFNQSQLSGLIKKWSCNRGQITAESSGASSKYFVYLTRADKAPSIDRIVWSVILHIISWIVMMIVLVGALSTLAFCSLVLYSYFSL